MLAILVTKGTKYACNHYHNGDLICLQSWSQKGLNMLEISNLNRTIYACNRFQKGPNMRAIIEVLFSRDSSRNHSHVPVGRFLTLQANKNQIVSMMASI